jgi:hypothetical protein
MKWPAALLILLHGLVHFLGFAKAFGLAELPQLPGPVSPSAGVAWLLAGVALVTFAVLFVAAPRLGWSVGLVAVVLSQAVIVTAWSDAKFGTLGNALVLLLALYGLASQGPWSLRAEYRRAVGERLADAETASPVVTEDDLATLPEPVQRYVRRAGAVGRPRATHLRARWTGRIRGSPDEPWMPFTAEQVNVIDDPARFFMMGARRSGLPVDVLHVFRDAAASMRVRLLSVVSMVDADGPELTRAETVTLLNDLSILAPGALTDPAVRWEAIDGRSARAAYTVGPNTVSAVLHFDELGDLVDFVSDDRSAASSDGRALVRQRWSTPLSDYRTFGPWRVAGRGEGRWHPADGADFVYIELELIELSVNPGRMDRAARGPGEPAGDSTGSGPRMSGSAAI